MDTVCDYCSGRGIVSNAGTEPEPCPACQPPADEATELADYHAAGNGSEDLLAGLRTGAWLDAQDFPPLVYHLPGVIPEGSNLLCGPPKVGKSWLVLALGLAAADGGCALDLQVDPRPVLYLALEDGDRRLQDRCRKLLPGAKIPGEFQYLTRVQPGRLMDTINTWLTRYPNDAPLVILDTLGKAMPPAFMGESTYGRDYRVGSELKLLADERPGSALLVNHHDRKAGSEDFVEKVSGSNGLAGSADTIVVLARGRNEDSGTLSVTGRDVAEGIYAVRFDGPRGLWSLDGGDLAEAAAIATQRRVVDGLDERSRAVIAYVNEHPEGVSPAFVAKDLDMEASHARQYLSRLYDRGASAPPARGTYTPLPTRVASVAVSRSGTSQRDTATDATHLRVVPDGENPL